MALRPPARLIAILLLPMLAAAVLAATPGRAADFIDSAGRHVVLPDRIGRVMAAGPPAEVLVFVLAPGKLIGWTEPRGRSGRVGVPARYARLPVIGRLTGPHPTANVAMVRRLRPDLIIDAGAVTPAYVALADRIQQQTGIPYILVDDSIARMPAILRSLGAVLGVSDRAEDLAFYAEHAIAAVRGKLLIQPANSRPRYYYGLGPDGLVTTPAESSAVAAIDEAGAINVAGPGPGRRVTVTPAQLLAWNPDIVIAQRPSFYNALRRDPWWRRLAAVRNKAVYLAPDTPFGWIDEPPGVNRLVGLYWLTAVLYPDIFQEDLTTTVDDFYQKFYGFTLSAAQAAALVRPAEARLDEARRQAGETFLSTGATPGMPGGMATSPGSPYATPPTSPLIGEPGRRGIVRGITPPTAPSPTMPH